jgi:hypothetical protein
LEVIQSGSKILTAARLVAAHAFLGNPIITAAAAAPTTGAKPKPVMVFIQPRPIHATVVIIHDTLIRIQINDMVVT